MSWDGIDTWIVVLGVLAGMSSALLGSYLLLRKMSLMGDAISHAVLPGLAIAFLVTMSRDSIPMFIGAAILGVLTAIITQLLHRRGKIEENASLGVVFTTLFAVGLILISLFANKVHLDASCVLYGNIVLSTFDKVSLWGWMVPRAAAVLFVVLIIDVAVVVILFKELRITSFDPAMADTVGFNPWICQYVLMSLVAVTAVAAFEVVGSILVVAMIIVPPATAYLLTDRLITLLLLSVVLGAVAAGLGHVAAMIVPGWFGFEDTETAGMMAVLTGVLFLLALLAAPRYGILGRLAYRVGLSLRIAREDVLGFLYRAEELNPTKVQFWQAARIGKAVGTSRSLTRMALGGLRRMGQLERRGMRWSLTDNGRRHAASLVRSHRLWETYLARHFDVPLDHVHRAAMDLEHVTDPAMQAALAEEVDNPRQDPHGRPLPDPKNH